MFESDFGGTEFSSQKYFSFFFWRGGAGGCLRFLSLSFLDVGGAEF